MASTSDIFDIKQKHLVGKLVFAEQFGKIVDISLPDSKDIFTVTHEDLPIKNIQVFNDFLPIFAEHEVLYAGQPILAVFGDDTDSVDLFISRIQITIDPTPNQNIQTQLDFPFRYVSGNIDAYFKEDANLISSDYEIQSHSEPLLSSQKFYCTVNGDEIYLKVPSQWPLHVRKTVASVLKIQEQKVFIIPQTFHANYDQLVLDPSAAAVITAIAAEKSGSMIELQMPISSWQPKTLFHFDTQLNEDNKIIAHRVFAEIDCGAFPLFINEICNNIMTGLISSYNFSAFEIQIQINRSNTNPAVFFAGLGYSMALAATEHHLNLLIRKINRMPSAWRIDNISKSSGFGSTVRKVSDPEALPITINECVIDSHFDRKNSIYKQVGNIGTARMSVMSYVRGVGIACGQGIHGFSNKFAQMLQYSVKLTLAQKSNANSKYKMTVYVGLQTDRHLKRIYREVIRNFFDIEYDDISFADINDEATNDAGPNVLSRAVGNFPILLEHCCAEIKEEMAKGTPLPITKEYFNSSSDSSHFFLSSSNGTLVLDLHMDMAKIVPVIDNITVRLKVGKVYDTNAFTNSVRHIISETISEVCPCAENLSDIDLKVRSNPNLEPGSCSSLIRGLTIGALTTALSQAMQRNVSKIPIEEETFLKLLQSKENN